MGHRSVQSRRRRYGERPKKLVEKVASQATDRVIPDLTGSGSSRLLRLESILSIAFLPATGGNSHAAGQASLSGNERAGLSMVRRR
jgi:hypothetical protein